MASITNAKVENARCEHSDDSIPPWQYQPDTNAISRINIIDI